VRNSIYKKSSGIIIIGILFLSLSSCDQGKEKRLKSKPVYYFDLESFFNGQIEMLTKENPKLKKTVTLDGATETKHLSLDVKDWRTELDIFYQADLNKRDLKDEYFTTEGESNGLKYIQYKAKTPEKVVVDDLIIYYREELNRPIRLEAWLSKKNSLYQVKQHISSHFEENEEGKLLLASYDIDGGQMVSFQEQTDYHVNGELSY